MAEYTEHHLVPKLDCYVFSRCHILDFDISYKGKLTISKEDLGEILEHTIKLSQTPCILEETTNGFHVIILSHYAKHKKLFYPIPGFDERYETLSCNVMKYPLRTRRKEHETKHFILGRRHFLKQNIDQHCLEEFCDYSTKILINYEKTWEDDEEEDFQSPF